MREVDSPAAQGRGGPSDGKLEETIAPEADSAWTALFNAYLVQVALERLRVDGKPSSQGYPTAPREITCRRLTGAGNPSRTARDAKEGGDGERNRGVVLREEGRRGHGQGPPPV